MSGRLSKAMEGTMFYVILGALLSVGSFVVSYIVVFTEDIIPMGDMGKYIVVFITLALNGFLVLLIGMQQKKVKGAVETIVPS